MGYRIEQGTRTEEYFFVFEMDLPNDKLGPLIPPAPVPEAEARFRLAELGLSTEAVEKRISRARQWMATRVLEPGATGALWLPPL